MVYISSYVGDTSEAKSCVSLMPYTLVTPRYPPICRPVLLLPTVLGRILDKKLAGWQGFQLCEPGRNYISYLFLLEHTATEDPFSDTETGGGTFLCRQIILFDLRDHMFVCVCKAGEK